MLISNRKGLYLAHLGLVARQVELRAVVKYFTTGHLVYHGVSGGWWWITSYYSRLFRHSTSSNFLLCPDV